MRRVAVALISALWLAQIDTARALPLRQVSVCDLTWNTAELIGQRVRVEGYIFDLSSHGIALISKRRQCSRVTSVSLMGAKVYPLLYKAVAKSGGPKRVIIFGTVTWHPARLGGHNPGLVVEQVEHISTHDADLKDF